MVRAKHLCAAKGCGQRVRLSQVFCGWHWCCLTRETRNELTTKQATGYWSGHAEEYARFLKAAIEEVAAWQAQLAERKPNV